MRIKIILFKIMLRVVNKLWIKLLLVFLFEMVNIFKLGRVVRINIVLNKLSMLD